MVGAAGFEPATTCSQSRYATRLRYAPIKIKKILLQKLYDNPDLFKDISRDYLIINCFKD
tara:strand:+ start:96 stop:275 length:180 start_codon:yes stop_codon:yes gene_type:complete